MTERILGIILPVFSVIALGYFWGRRVRPDMGQVNRISMNVLAPALIFSALSSKGFDVRENAVLLAGSVGIVLGSGLLAWPIARLLREDPRTFVPPMMFNNCGNMGLPLAVLAFGEAGFGPMVALFTISNLLHFTLGAGIIDHAPHPRPFPLGTAALPREKGADGSPHPEGAVERAGHGVRHARFGRLLRNPMVWSTVAGFAFAIVQPPVPEWIAVSFKLVGDGLIPLMLLSLGVRLVDIDWHDTKIGFIGGLVCPLTGLAMAAVLAPLLGLNSLQTGLLYLFGALPPAVLNFMVAEQYRQEPGKVASIVLIGNVMSVIFIPVGLALALRA
jgi:predicted permease